MKQTRDEQGFIPFSCEMGKARQIERIRIAYSLLSSSGMKNAHSSRLFLFKNEAQGYKRALSYQHNRARFSYHAVLLPPRERAQQNANKTAERDEQRRQARVALRYGKRYGTLTTATIDRARQAGIAIRRAGARPIASNAVLQRITELISSEMMKRESSPF